MAEEGDHGAVRHSTMLSRIILITVLVLVAGVGVLWLGQRRLIYLPDRADVPAAATVLPTGQDLVLTTEDGLRLRAWLVGPAPTRPDRRVAVLLAPGNGGNRLDRAPLARALSDAGLTVLLVDYRGYGGNPGRPSEDGLVKDVRAARAALASLGWPAERVVYFGESLGCAVVARLAIDQPPAGLVLRSPFVDLAAAGQHNYPWLPVRPLLWDRLPVADLVARVHAPTVVIYGNADTIIPPQQSEAVARRASGLVRTVVVDGADHNDPSLVDGAQVVAGVGLVTDRIG